MTTNPDGTASCTNCGASLDGYGVIFGLLASRVESDGTLANYIFCYENGCANTILQGHLNH